MIGILCCACVVWKIRQNERKSLLCLCSLNNSSKWKEISAKPDYFECKQVWQIKKKKIIKMKEIFTVPFICSLNLHKFDE